MNLSDHFDTEFLPLSARRGIQLLYPFPTGQAGAYNPAAADCLIIAPGAVISEPHASSLDAAGYLYGTTNYGTYARCTGLPARGAGPRVHRITGWMHTSLATGDGLKIHANYTNDSNFWQIACGWSGSTLNLTVYEVNAGVSTQRGLAVMSAVALPMFLTMELWEAGDFIAGRCTAWESDTTTDFETIAVDYNVASRLNKTVTTCQIGHNQNPGANAKILEWEVYDVP